MLNVLGFGLNGVWPGWSPTSVHCRAMAFMNAMGMGTLTGGIRVRLPHRIALAGLSALALLAAGCSSGSPSGTSGGTNWSTVTSASAGGGMTKLIAAAKQEGTLNVIALPSDWANYGTIIKDFTAKYRIKVNSIAPDDSSAQEVTQIQQKNGSAR